jgi:phosphoadenosine phosphosulfate reductase
MELAMRVQVMSDDLAELLTSGELENYPAEELLGWALNRFGNRVALASSFGVEDMVVAHLMVKLDPKARVFTLDTGRLPQETYALMDRVRERLGIKIEVVFPDAQAVQKMVNEKGLNLFYHSVENRHECCRVRKVEPLNRALAGLGGWITGLRREQAVTRREVRKVERDEDHGGILKLNPLADWTQDQVWAYIREHDVPYHPWHNKGYPSLGCLPCTRAVRPGEDARAGRWWWEQSEQKECGLHVRQPAQADPWAGNI